MAYSILAEPCRTEGELEELDIRVGMIHDPRDEALEELRKHQEAMGLKFENPDAPVAGDGTGWMDEEFR